MAYLLYQLPSVYHAACSMVLLIAPCNNYTLGAPCNYTVITTPAFQIRADTKSELACVYSCPPPWPSRPSVRSPLGTAVEGGNCVW